MFTKDKVYIEVPSTVVLLGSLNGKIFIDIHLKNKMKGQSLMLRLGCSYEYVESMCPSTSPKYIQLQYREKRVCTFTLLKSNI